MDKGTFYAVGVGPGDPSLLTLQAVRVLERCPVVAAVRTSSGQMLALDIATGAAKLDGKEILPLAFSMSRDEAIRQTAHRDAANQIIACLEAGRDVAMPNLGDVSIYSTALYVLELIRQAGFPVEMVPGVPSFCAIAAKLGTSLTSIEKPLHIIPVCHEGLEEALALPGTKVLMKTGKSIAGVKQALAEAGLLDKAMMVENCGLPDERIVRDLIQTGDETGYFTTIVV